MPAVVYNLVDDTALRVMASSCRQLQRLELRACEKVTARGLQVGPSCAPAAPRLPRGLHTRAPHH